MNKLTSQLIKRYSTLQQQLSLQGRNRNFEINRGNNRQKQQSLQQRYIQQFFKNAKGNIRSLATLNNSFQFSVQQSIENTVAFESDPIKIINSEQQENFRNVAIIAHVDHGKTTLVDTLLAHCGLGLNHERSMDGNELEKEKGITILSKCTTLTYQGHKVNMVDTPGHCDFGGEVERIMGMVDSVILLVCATEGPMPQTRYVLQKAVRQGIKPIVVINKVDRPTARPQEVVNEIFDLFIDLEIEEKYLDYPIFFCSGRDGWAVQSLEELKQNDTKDISVIMDAIIKHVPAPIKNKEGPTQILVSQTESNKYFGKMVIGRIESGVITIGEKLTSIDAQGNLVENGKIQKILKKHGMETIEIQRAVAGDIVSIAGFSNSTVTNTLNTVGNKHVIPSIPIDPPIISVSINVNTSPLAGKEGSKMSKNVIKQRLVEEADNDVALKLEGVDSKNDSSEIQVKGRGDLHLGILIEKMRREGYEMTITPPIILFKEDNDGNLLEPVEKISIECDPIYVPSIIEKLGNRGAIYENSLELNPELHRVIFVAPTRGLIGFRTVLLNDTKGTANYESQLIGYEPHKGDINRNNKGALISTATGLTTAYAISNLEQFGQMFIKPNQQVYTGMVIGEHLKEGDMEINPTKVKQLTNIRTKAADEKILIQPHRQFSVEEAVSYIRENEMVEVTPKEIRIRKRELNSGLRKRDEKQSQSKSKSKK